MATPHFETPESRVRAPFPPETRVTMVEVEEQREALDLLSRLVASGRLTLEESNVFQKALRHPAETPPEALNSLAESIDLQPTPPPQAVTPTEIRVVPSVSSLESEEPVDLRAHLFSADKIKNKKRYFAALQNVVDIMKGINFQAFSNLVRDGVIHHTVIDMLLYEILYTKEFHHGSLTKETIEKLKELIHEMRGEAGRLARAA